MQRFVKQRQKEIAGKIDKLCSLKLRTSAHRKTSSNHRLGENSCNTYIWQRLTSGLHNELPQINKKKTIQI